MSRKPVLLRVSNVAVLGLTLAAATAWGHHGWGGYNRDAFSLSGIVVETHLGNPHDRLTVEADGQRWNVVMSPPSRSRNAGFNETAVAVGDRVTAYGNRHANPDVYEMKTARIQVEGRNYDLYPSRL
jgi:hypothetical protein